MKASSCTARDLACRAGVDQRKISYLLKAERKSSTADVARILHHLHPLAPHQDRILKIAAEVERDGWWQRYRIEMGSRQADYADLEADAEIFEFSQTLFPGLLQTKNYAMSRAIADRSYHSKRFLVHRAVEARKLRQQVLSGPAARGYQVVLDESVFRRAVATPAVIREQINHMVGVAMQMPAVTIRILTLGTPLPGEAVPATSFSIYRYRELGGLEIVAVETDDTDILITDSAKAAMYRQRYELLSSAALSPSDSLDFLVTEAERMSEAAGRSR
jgi:hypothetical protein